MRRFTLLLGATLTLAAMAQGTLPEAVVEAGRGGADFSQRADTAEWTRLGIGTMQDALRTLSGVVVKDYGTPGSAVFLSVKGLAASHTQVVVDGVPLHDALGGAIDLSGVAFGSLAALTLTDAAAGESLLLPAEALCSPTLVLERFSRFQEGGGLKTRELENLKTYPKACQVSFRTTSLSEYTPQMLCAFQAGRRGTLLVDAQCASSRGRFRYKVENGRASYHEWRRHARLLTPEGRVAWHTALGKRGAQAETEIHVRHADQQLPDLVTLYTQSATETCTTDDGQLLARIYKKECYHLTAAWSRRRTLYENADPAFAAGAQRYEYTEQNLYASLGAAIPLPLRALQLAAVLDIRHTDLLARGAALTAPHTASHTHPRHTLLTPAINVAYRWHQLQLTARLAMQSHHLDGESGMKTSRLLPAINLTHRTLHIPRLTLHTYARAALSHRLPTMSERYFYHLGTVAPLRPERSRLLAAGLRTTLHQPIALSLDAEIFATRTDDCILSIPYNLFVMRTENIGHTTACGTEIRSTLQQTLPRQATIAIQLAYTYQHTTATVTSTAAKTTSARQTIPYQPAHTLNLAFTYTHPRLLTASLSLHTESERWSTRQHLTGTRLRPYTTLRPAISRSWHLTRRDPRPIKLHTTLAIPFAPSAYEVVRRYPMPRYAIEAQLRLTF